MKKITLVILLALVACSAIAKTHKHKKKAAKAATGITSVQLYHTGCFGHCPTYIIDLNRNGMATFTAVRFNTDSGTFQKNIGAAKVAEILNRMDSMRVDTCQDMYVNPIPDLPTQNFEITYATKKVKKIYSATYGPAFIQRIATSIEAAGKKTDNAGWKRIPDAK